MKRTKKPPLPPVPGDLSFIVDFVNTKDQVASTDSWTRPVELRDWLTGQGLVEAPGRLGEADLERARAVRRGLRTLLAANSGEKLDKKAVADLNQRTAEATCRVRFAEDGESRLEPESASLDGALGRLCGIVAVAQAEGSWRRVKICANPTCQRAYYDDSRSRPRSCCTTRCRNRLNSRTYRRRHSGR